MRTTKITTSFVYKQQFIEFMVVFFLAFRKGAVICFGLDLDLSGVMGSAYLLAGLTLPRDELMTLSM